MDDDEIYIDETLTDFLNSMLNGSHEDLLEDGGDFFQSSALYKVEAGIQNYAPPLQVISGLVGNIMTVIIMLRLKDHLHPLCSYLVVMATVDTMVTLLHSGNEWLMKIYSPVNLKVVMNRSEIMCKVMTFCEHLFIHLSAWVLVTVIIENLVINLRPKVIQDIKSSRVMDVMCFLLVLVICLNLHYFWTYGIVDIVMYSEVKEKYCFFQTRTLKGESHRTDGLIWLTLDAVFVEYLPIIVLIICLSITHCVQSSRNRNSARLNQRQEWAKECLDSPALVELTSKTLLVIGWFFPVTAIPKVLHFHLNKYFHNSVWTLTFLVIQEWNNLFYSSKFLLYLLSSRRVRQETKLVLAPVTRLIVTVTAPLRAKWHSFRNTSRGSVKLPQEDIATFEQEEAYV